MELPFAEMGKIVGGAGLRDNQVIGHSSFEMLLQFQSGDIEKEGKLAHTHIQCTERIYSHGVMGLPAE